MSEQNVQVRSVARQEREGLFELAAAFVGGASRLSLSLATIPLVLLPRDSRRRVRRAMAEVARAIVALPRELTDVSVRVVDEIYEGGTNSSSSSGPGFTERARNFTERLARAAEEFTASLNRASRQAGDSAERAASRVDEWVEKA
jgi:hypothetical protein